MTKEKGYKLYKSVRPIVKAFFMKKYKPEIINSSVIPKSGPIIFAGNHLNALDQMPVICSTNRFIHWMAKKEYFDSAFGFVFRMSGCISVDRKNNPAPSMLEAMHYLKKGSAIGLFPEGTRNKYEIARINVQKIQDKIDNLENEIISPRKQLEQLKILLNELESAKRLLEAVKEEYQKENIEYKEEELLRPFLNGATLMARKTDATIIPFGITGDFKLNNNNLILRFGEPFKVINSNEANNELRKQVGDLIRENYKQKTKKKQH